MASASHPPEQPLFGIFNDKSFPSFYLPGGSFSDGVPGSNPTGGGSPDLSPTSVAGPSVSEHSQSKRSPRMRSYETSHKGAQPPEALANPIVERWFNPEPGVWKPKGLLTEENLPTTTYVAPVPSAYVTRTRSPSSTLTDLSINPPPSTASWISASSGLETSTSILNSQFGTSTSGSVARFPSSAGLTSSYYSSSTARSATHGRVASEDGSPIEPSRPRQTLFVVNGDPDSFGPQRFRDLSGPSPQPGYSSDTEVALSSPAAKGSIPAEWIYPLSLTLEELFKGGTYTYRITARLLSGEHKIQEVGIDVKSGWKRGTRITVPDVGNERAPGVFQTVIFVVEEVQHWKFEKRKGGKLVFYQHIGRMDALKDNGRREARKVVGLDGKVIEFYPPKGTISNGQETVIKGEGMYVRSKITGVRRGDLCIRWHVTDTPPSIIQGPPPIIQGEVIYMGDISKQ